MTGIAYELVGAMPEPLTAALFLLIPVYFLCYLWEASRQSEEKPAMTAGLVLGPLFYVYVLGLDLLWNRTSRRHVGLCRDAHRQRGAAMNAMTDAWWWPSM